jgi:hypothetical protein
MTMNGKARATAAGLDAGEALSNPPRGVHYTELPEMKAGEPLAAEWNTYRRQIGRWLTEGREGTHVLLKGEEVLGFFDTFEAACAEGVKRYLTESFFVHPIRTEEPYLRIRGINHPWHSSVSRLRGPALRYRCGQGRTAC